MFINKCIKSSSGLTLAARRNFKAAVILAGCGVYDGSEITEAVSLFIALSKHGAQYNCYAPNTDQAHVVNHTNGSEMQEKRNVLTESARIARGNIQDLANIDVNQYDAVLLPGGFGAAKNLSDFAFKGGDMKVNPSVEKTLKAFHKSQKVLGFVCISPIVAARVFGTKFGGPGVTLTLGKRGDAWPHNGSIDVGASFGNTMNDTVDSNGICVDQKNKIYSTPAYMKGDAKACDVYEGIEKMVAEIAKSLKK